MKKIGIALLGVVLLSCTPTVKEVTLKKDTSRVTVLKKAELKLSKEEARFVDREANRLGIEVPDKKLVEIYVAKLLRNRKSIETALKRASLYIPYITPILRKYGLPEELAILPLIESRFNPFAVSRSGAAGIWQLMPGTARNYGLRVDSELDERFDLIKSTHAAARYLRDLYTLFGDWSLAIAAYNCGEGCIIRRTGGKDFWENRHILPEETRNYVPLFFASLLIARSPGKYGLRVEEVPLKLTKKVVKREKSVRELIRKFRLKESTFRDMNPHIKSDIIPAGTYVYLPKAKKEKVIVLENGAVLYIKD